MRSSVEVADVTAAYAPTDTAPVAPATTSDVELRVPKVARSGRLALWLSISWLGLVVLAALAADLLPLRDVGRIVDDLPSRTGLRWSWHEPLGTDDIGRSTLSRVIFGARQSLLVGVGTVTITATIGLLLGMTAGYLRGRFDAMMNIFLDALLAVPALVLLVAVAAVGRRDLPSLILSLSVVGVPYFARLSRAHTLRLSQREYILAARSMGAGHIRILGRELLPNVMLPVLSFAFLFLAVVTVAEGSLAFLGLGVPPPTPSWGGMVNAGRSYLESDPHLVFIPSLCLLFTVMAFTVVGDRARRHLDPGSSAL